MTPGIQIQIRVTPGDWRNVIDFRQRYHKKSPNLYTPTPSDIARKKISRSEKKPGSAHSGHSSRGILAMWQIC